MATTVVGLTWQGGGVRDVDVAPGAGIDATKVIHQTTVTKQLFAEATTVTAKSEIVWIVSAETGEIVDFDAAIFGAISGGADYTVTVDLHKSTGGGAFATVMDSTIEFDDTAAVRTAFSGVILDTDLVAGDILKVVVTVAGASGTQATGLAVALTTRERPTA